VIHLSNCKQRSNKTIICGACGLSLSFMLGAGNALAASDVVSDADTSVMLEAVASGVNPYVTPLSTTFYCYGGEPGSDPEQPYMTMAIKDDWVKVKAAGQQSIGRIKVGEEGNIVISAQDESLNAELDVTEFGQIIKPSGRDVFGACFQKGAANDAALHQIRLNMPEKGEYQCQFSGDKPFELSLEFRGNDRYRVNKRSGTYSSIASAEETVGEIYFDSGELEGISATYYEQPNSGVQTLQMELNQSKSYAFGASQTSSSESVGTCNRVREARPFARYGKDLAPSIAKPKKALTGFYLMDVSELTSTSKHSYARYVKFTADGRFYSGIPENRNIDCTRTQPSGLPVCQRYDFDGSTLKLYRGEHLIDSVRAVTNGNGSLVIIDATIVELVKPIEISQIIGSWENETVDGGNFNMCLIGYCSASIDNVSLHFRKDGKFLINSSSDSFSSANTGVVASFSKGKRNENGSGTYHVEDGSVTLNFYNGEIEKMVAAITSKKTLALGEMQYQRVSE